MTAKTALSLLAGAALAVALLARWATPAAADSPEILHLGYYGYLGDARVLDLSVELTLRPERYRVAAALDAADALRGLLPFRFTAEAAGAAGQGPVRPERYSSLAALGQARKGVRVTYEPGETVAVAVDPPRPAGRPATVPQAESSLDPLSAALAAVLDLARSGVCRGRYPVFDGIRRYDLALAPVGPAVLRPSRFALYAGPARECLLRIGLGAGFREADIRAGLYPEVVRVWFAPAIADGPTVPVRFAARSALGALRLDLVAAGPVPPSPPSQ